MKAGLTIIAAALCLAACSETPRDNPATDTVANIDTGEHRWTAPDGEQMPYVVTGNGEVTVIL
ncbi:MAG TPA: hypothetical protein VMO24_02920, partial [Woeseiaceae bacterium]|nr:hypothetical protein [Woeseiaceae bacterium]